MTYHGIPGRTNHLIYTAVPVIEKWIKLFRNQSFAGSSIYCWKCYNVKTHDTLQPPLQTQRKFSHNLFNANSQNLSYHQFWYVKPLVITNDMGCIIKRPWVTLSIAIIINSAPLFNEITLLPFMDPRTIIISISQETREKLLNIFTVQINTQKQRNSLLQPSVIQSLAVHHFPQIQQNARTNATTKIT